MKTNEYSDEFRNRQECDGGFRDMRDVTCIVLHSTQGPTARGGALTLTSRPDASVQIVLDNEECYRIVADNVVPCGVRDVNSWTLHIEQAGFAEWSKGEWMKHRRTIQRAAFWTALWERRYRIPHRFLTTADLDAGRRRGWTTHNELSQSDISSSTHWDPGPRWPALLFTSYVRFYKLSYALFRNPKPKVR